MMINSNLNLLVKLFIGPDSDNDWRTKICIIYVLRSTSQSQSNNCLSKIEKIFQPSSGNIGCNHLHHQDHQDQDHHLGRLNAKLFMLHNINSQPFHLKKKGFFTVINDIIINIIDIIDIFIMLNIHKLNITAGSPHSSFFFFTLLIFFLPAAQAIWSEISRGVLFSADLKRC